MNDSKPQRIYSSELSIFRIIAFFIKSRLPKKKILQLIYSTMILVHFELSLKTIVWKNIFTILYCFTFEIKMIRTHIQTNILHKWYLFDLVYALTILISNANQCKIFIRKLNEKKIKRYFFNYFSTTITKIIAHQRILKTFKSVYHTYRCDI